MKKFSTLQDLLKYMQYCKICNESCRKFYVSTGPDDIFTIKNYHIYGRSFIIVGNCYIKNPKIISFTINCQNNTFDFSIKEKDTNYNINFNKANKPYLYFYIYSKCYKCDSYESNSSDIELDLFRHKLNGIGMEHETLYVLNDDVGFKIEYEYNENIVNISEYNKNVINKKALFALPDSLALDFSDKDKLLNKLKTMILFS
jgi:hypothetical protein